MKRIAEITGLSEKDLKKVKKLRNNSTACAIIQNASELEYNEVLVIFHGSKDPEKNKKRILLVYLEIKKELGHDCFSKYEFFFLSCWGAKMPSYVMNRHLNPIEGRLTLAYLFNDCVEPCIDVYQKD